MKVLVPLIAITLSTCLIQNTMADDDTFQHGKKLFEEGNCIQCHHNRPFNGPNTRVHTLKSLNTMVEACNTRLGLGWFPEEIEAVSYFLNLEYYKFPALEETNQ
jgi:predicted small secreted protein